MSEVERTLRHYSRLVQPAITGLLTARDLPKYLSEPMGDYPARGGKRLRPALMLATCEAFGGLHADAIPSAVALELLHNGFLVHDDIEDRSEIRRGEPTLHRRFGLPLAVHAGDALSVWGAGALRPNRELLGDRLAARIYDEFDFMARQTAIGQASDLGWRLENRLDLSPDDYLNLIMQKTCWYTTILPLRVGALIGSRGRADVDAMIVFGFSLGAAFQIRDDLLNLIGDPSIYGKERFGDIREGKRTLMLIHLLASVESADRDWLEDFLSPKGRRDLRACGRVYEMMKVNGSVEFAQEFAEGIADSARSSFATAFEHAEDGDALSFVESMIPYMVARMA